MSLISDTNTKEILIHYNEIVGSQRQGENLENNKRETTHHAHELNEINNKFLRNPEAIRKYTNHLNH